MLRISVREGPPAALDCSEFYKVELYSQTMFSELLICSIRIICPDNSADESFSESC